MQKWISKLPVLISPQPLCHLLLLQMVKHISKAQEYSTAHQAIRSSQQALMEASQVVMIKSASRSKTPQTLLCTTPNQEQEIPPTQQPLTPPAISESINPAYLSLASWF